MQHVVTRDDIINYYPAMTQAKGLCVEKIFDLKVGGQKLWFVVVRTMFTISGYRIEQKQKKFP